MLVQSSQVSPLVEPQVRGLSAKGGHLLPAERRISGGVNGGQITYTWSTDYRTVSINKTHQQGSNFKIRFFEKTQRTIFSYPAKIRFEVDVTQTFGFPLNTKEYTNRTPNPTDFGMYLSVKDDDEIIETPAYLNKQFFQVFTGSNSIEFTIFDDGDIAQPSIDLILHKSAIYNLVLSNIKIFHVDGRL